MKALIATVALVGIVSSGTASGTSGNQMAANCRAFISENTSTSQYYGAGVCAGFVSGVTNTLVMARIASPETTHICIPIDGFTMGQAARVLLKYFDDHPQTLNQDASLLALMAYKDAYPCKP
jgi:hypothetical protein